MEIILLKYLDSYIPIRDTYRIRSGWNFIARIARILYFHQLRSHKYYENARGLFATYFPSE